MPAASKPKPPNDISGLLPPPTDWVLIAGVGLFVVIVVLCLFMLFRWYKNNKIQKLSAVPKVSVDDVAEMILQLEKMQPMTPFAAKEREEFFFELSVKLRTFLELKSGTPFTDMTMSEISRVWDDLAVEMGSADKQQALEFLMQADRIKFAKEDVGVVQAERFRDTVVGWLRTVDGRMMR